MVYLWCRLKSSTMKSFKSHLIYFSLVFLVTGCQKDTDDIANAVPVVDAGPPQTIMLPVNNLTITGSATDDGQVVAYLWSQVSGPGPTTIVNPGSPSTVINGFIAGAYVFQLMATDDLGATGVDTVRVTVSPGMTQTLTLQPFSNPNERMLVSIGGSDFSATGSSELIIDAWTVGGAPYIGRAAIKFDLAAIPTSATIVSANLFLYSNTPPENGNLIDANFGTTNSLFLQQITSSWTAGSATWFNQPTVTATNQVAIPATTQSSLDLNIDVKNMVASMVNSNANYGFLLRLENEVTYNSRMFVSSYHPTKAAKRPKLVILYQP